MAVRADAQGPRGFSLALMKTALVAPSKANSRVVAHASMGSAAAPMAKAAEAAAEAPRKERREKKVCLVVIASLQLRFGFCSALRKDAMNNTPEVSPTRDGSRDQGRRRLLAAFQPPDYAAP